MAVLSKVFTAAVAASSLFAGAMGHTSGTALVPREIHEANARRSLANCEEKLKARGHVEKRNNKRNAFVERHLKKKRDLGMAVSPNPNRKRSEASDLFPTVECILTPEITIGPYYVDNQYIRDDIREEQEGIELLVDVQLVDTNTCEVIPNQYVDFWHCNTTGTYSGVSAEDTVGLTFLRGLAASDEDGIIQLTTTFPGWYDGRATHIHTLVHLNGTVLENGTYTGGTIGHIGQIFFPEEILEEVAQADIYNTNTVVRTTNAEDMWFPSENSTGYYAEATVEYLGTSLTDGLLAYISIGVDTTADYIENVSIADSGDSDIPSGGMPSGGIPSGSAPSGFAPVSTASA